MARVAEVRGRSGRAAMVAVVVLILLLAGVANAAGVDQRSTGPDRPWVEAFDLISQDEGWLLAGGRLYWTSTAGQGWAEITPAGLDRSKIQAVTFLDSRQGWMILTQDGQGGNVEYTLGRTSDGGQTWRTSRLSLFEPGAPELLPGAVYLFFLDARTGWLVVRQATSSNFRLGSLFRTTDGGESWTREQIPIGEPVYFVTREAGWTAGGAAGNELYYTLDGGQSWQPQTVRFPQTEIGPQRLTYLPRFDSPLTGTLPVVALSAGPARFELYATSDGGRSWELAVSVPLEPAITPGRAVALSTADAHTWVVAASGSRQILRVSDSGRVEVADRGDLASQAAGIVELDMATADAGWARSTSGRCENPAQEEDGSQAPTGRADCRQLVSLLRTEDGGRGWRVLSIPEADLSQTTVRSDTGVPKPVDAYVAASRTRWWVGQGFDKCEAATLGELQTWKDSSPYGAVNLYIGGSCRSCDNLGLTAQYVTQATQQGWRLIPTWVGPQSACSSSSCGDEISNDPIDAYNQGVAEANAAIVVAVDLGLALPDGSGTIVYYDLEYYSDNPNDPTCREAAKAFISGWSGRLREWRSLAGLYTTCSYMIKYWTLDNVPDAIWPARWLYDSYNPDASVWDLACMDNSLWPGHQRILQYAGGHYETWGDVALNIDCDVSEGIVAWLGGGECCFCTRAAGCDEQSPAFSPESFRGPSLPEVSVPATGTPAPGTAAGLPASGLAMEGGPVEAQRTPPASGSYRIPRSVLSSGGSEKSSASFIMNSTLGQSTDLRRRESDGYVLIPGYWGRWYAVVKLDLYLPLVVKRY